MCLSKYVSGYVRTYAGLCRALRRRLRLFLNLNLNLNLNLSSYAALNRASLQKPFEKPNPTLFHRLDGLKYRSLYDLVNLAPYRQTQPPGRPVGR